jgi:hypothetical protein
MNKLNFMAQWSDVVQMVNFMATQDFILDAAEGLSSGKALGEAQTLKLSKLGLDQRGLRAIWKQFRKHGTAEGKDGEVKTLNLDRWFETEEGANAARLARGSISTAANLMNMVAGVGDRPLGSLDTPLGPLGFQTPLGKMMTMYTSYGFAAISRVGLMRLQARDQGAIHSSLMALGLGAMVVQLRAAAAGRPGPQDEREWIAESVDRSGLLGWLTNADMLLGIATDGRVGINAWTHHPNARFSPGAMLHTGVGAGGSWLINTAKSAYGIPSDLAASGDVSPTTASRLRRSLPYNNLFYLNALFNLLDQEPESDRFNTR